MKPPSGTSIFTPFGSSKLFSAPRAAAVAPADASPAACVVALATSPAAFVVALAASPAPLAAAFAASLVVCVALVAASPTVSVAFLAFCWQSRSRVIASTATAAITPQDSQRLNEGPVAAALAAEVLATVVSYMRLAVALTVPDAREAASPALSYAWAPAVATVLAARSAPPVRLERNEPTDPKPSALVIRLLRCPFRNSDCPARRFDRPPASSRFFVTYPLRDPSTIGAASARRFEAEVDFIPNIEPIVLTRPPVLSPNRLETSRLPIDSKPLVFSPPPR